MDDLFQCIRTLNIDNDLIDKIKNHIQSTMKLWRELKLPVTPSAYLLEDHILKQMISIKGGIARTTL